MRFPAAFEKISGEPSTFFSIHTYKMGPYDRYKWSSKNIPNTLPETNIAHGKSTIFPGKYHQNCGFPASYVSFREGKCPKMHG